MSYGKENVLSYEDIMSGYPNGWVVILDAELDQSNSELVKGRVVYHSDDRDKAYAELKKYKKQALTFFFTGDIPSDLVLC